VATSNAANQFRQSVVTLSESYATRQHSRIDAWLDRCQDDDLKQAVLDALQNREITTGSIAKSLAVVCDLTVSHGMVRRWRERNAV